MSLFIQPKFSTLTSGTAYKCHCPGITTEILVSISIFELIKGSSLWLNRMDLQKEIEALCVLRSKETQFQNEIFKILPEMDKTISKVEQYFNVDLFRESAHQWYPSYPQTENLLKIQ